MKASNINQKDQLAIAEFVFAAETGTTNTVEFNRCLLALVNNKAMTEEKKEELKEALTEHIILRPTEECKVIYDLVSHIVDHLSKGTFQAIMHSYYRGELFNKEQRL